MSVIASFFQYLFPHSGNDTIGFWSELPPMKTKRYGCAAATLSTNGNRRLVVMGGHNGSTETDSVEIFELEGGVWTLAGTNGGENSTPAVRSMKTRRLGCVAATLKCEDTATGSECIVVVGGHDGRRALASAERYHPCLNMWTDTQCMEIGGLFNAAAVGIGDRLYVVGGHNGKECSNRVDVFDANFCTWSPVAAPMLQKRVQCAAAALGKYIYVLGGNDGDRNVLDSVEVYDTVERIWSTLPPMTSKRQGCVAAAVGGRIYVFGGYDGKQTLKSAERYDPTTRTWSMIPPMKNRRFFSAVAVLQNKIFIVGGLEGGSGLSSVEVFTVAPRTEAEVTVTIGVAAESNQISSTTQDATTVSRSLTPLTETGELEKIPDELQCPITGDLMVHPVVASDGKSYEREAIEEWFRRFSPHDLPRSPTTNEPLKRLLFPNHNLKSLCRGYTETTSKDAA